MAPAGAIPRFNNDQKELALVEAGGGRFIGFEFERGEGPTRGAEAFPAASQAAPWR
jgi:hypothetical protein